MEAPTTSLTPRQPSGPRDLIPLGGRPRLRDYVTGVWARREFVYHLAAGELRGQHMNTALGNVWHVLSPLMLIAVYYLLFGVLFQRTRDDLVALHISYIAFLSIGVFTFGFMQRCFNNGANAIAGNMGLIRSLQFPRAVLPIATVTKETLSFVPSLAVMLAVLVLSGQAPRWSWLGFVPVFLTMTAFGLGGAFIMARLAEQVRDIKNVLPFAFRLAFYLSGVLFSVDHLVANRPRLEVLGDVFLLNPFYVFVSLSREYLLGLDSHSGTGMLWLAAACWATGLVAAGFAFFVTAEKRYGRG